MKTLISLGILGLLCSCKDEANVSALNLATQENDRLRAEISVLKGALSERPLYAEESAQIKSGPVDFVAMAKASERDVLLSMPGVDAACQAVDAGDDSARKSEAAKWVGFAARLHLSELRNFDSYHKLALKDPKLSEEQRLELNRTGSIAEKRAAKLGDFIKRHGLEK